MGDESSYRYGREGQTGRAPAPPSTAASDDALAELAELARLIGKDDPFADFGEIAPEPVREQTTRASQARGGAPMPQFSAPPVERRFEDWQPGRRQGREGQTQGAQPPVAPQPYAAPETPAYEPTRRVASEPTRGAVRQGYGSLARDGATVPQAHAPQADADSTQDWEHRDPHAGAYDETAYAYAPHGGQADARAGVQDDDQYETYDDDYDPAYDEDGYMPPHGEEVYEQEPRRRTGRIALIAVASLLGIGVAGAGGYFAFRSVGGEGGSGAGTAPVIRADTAPSKTAGPEPQGQDSNGQKLIYDRVGGGQPGQERMVPREEQPVDVNTAAAPAPSSPMAGANPTEPKKVRTMAVRADGTIVTGANASAPAQPANGPMPLAYAPTQNPIPVSAPTPTTVTTTTTNATGVPVNRTASAPANAPVAAASGDYVVQVSSQKTEADALGSWKVLQGRYPQLLNAYTASVRRADLGDRGVYYRAQVGPFNTREDANTLCNALRAQGGDCVVTRTN